MKLAVDRSQCVGTGICESTVPAVFEIDDDGRLMVQDENVTPDRLDAIRSAIANCPTQALSLME